MLIIGGNEPQISSKALQSFSLLQLVAGGYPCSGDAVRSLPLSLRNVEDLLFKQVIDISYDGALLVEQVRAAVRE